VAGVLQLAACRSTKNSKSEMYGNLTVPFVLYVSIWQQSSLWEAYSYSASQDIPPAFCGARRFIPYSQEGATFPHSVASWIQPIFPYAFYLRFILISSRYYWHETWSVKLTENSRITRCIDDRPWKVNTFPDVDWISSVLWKPEVCCLFIAALHLYLRWAILIQPPLFFLHYSPLCTLTSSTIVLRCSRSGDLHLQFCSLMFFGSVSTYQPSASDHISLRPILILFLIYVM
jgi:hypothetical protein